MKPASHKRIGLCLAKRHLCSLAPIYIHAFMLGCVQPDKNPTTYLKGSIRFEWFRGHNYDNSYKYMIRLCRRIKKKRTLTLFDYYQLGKLMHYIADSFTYAHTHRFGKNLYYHRLYEQNLDVYLQNHICKIPLDKTITGKAEDVIQSNRGTYSTLPHSVFHDIYYSINTCNAVLMLLLSH